MQDPTWNRLKERLSLQILQVLVVLGVLIGLGLFVHRKQQEGLCQAKQEEACLSLLAPLSFPTKALRGKVAEQLDLASANYKNQGKLDKAEAVLEKACARHLAASCKSLAWFLTLSGRQKEGVTAIKKACGYDPTFCSAVADMEEATKPKN